MAEAELDRAIYEKLLGELIGQARTVQNNPPKNVPREDNIADLLLKHLAPVITENGGPIIAKKVSYAEGRSNVILTYPASAEGGEKGIVSFVGAHMDVVPANPDEWERNPFELTVEGDKFYGRGTTDCLGHVALFAELFRVLGTVKPKLSVTVVGVCIANEENSSVSGIGVDELVKRGELDHLRKGPVYWVDSADKNPCIGTAGMQAWKLKGAGRLFHSGLPNKTVNPLELLMEGLSEVQRRFYATFPPHEKEAIWGFLNPSTMKPTQWHYPGTSINQIPAVASISGDIRLTPFYDMKDVKAAVEGFVADINANLSALPTRGPASKYRVPHPTEPGNFITGHLEVEWEGEPMNGIACRMDTAGYKALLSASNKVLGSSTPFSLTGSLPLVKELQEAGFDLQIMGYGLMSVYHAVNEYSLFSDLAQGFRIINLIIADINAAAAADAPLASN